MLTREEVSSFAEIVHNKEPIDWDYWADSLIIKPIEAARLAYHIEGFSCDDDKIPGDLVKPITRLTRWLESRSQLWTLADLVTVLGGGDVAPFGMVQAVKAKQQTEAVGDAGAGNHAGTETKNDADKTPRTRTDNLTRAINAAITTIGKKPSLDELWRYFEDDKDETGFIEDYTDTHITWRDTKGKMMDTQKESLANRLSRVNS